jgi:hypothetical protein
LPSRRSPQMSELLYVGLKSGHFSQTGLTRRKDLKTMDFRCGRCGVA